jgi:hypothetical protein
MPILLLIFLLASWLPVHSRPQWITIPLYEPDDVLMLDYNSIKQNGSVRSVVTYFSDPADRSSGTSRINIDCKSWMYSMTVYHSGQPPTTGNWFLMPPSSRAHHIADVICPK